MGFRKRKLLNAISKQLHRPKKTQTETTTTTKKKKTKKKRLSIGPGEATNKI